MKTIGKIEILLQILTFIVAIPSAGLLSLFAIFYVLLPGLMGLHLLGIFWGTAALAGTYGLGRFVLGAKNQWVTALCLGGGILAVSPILLTGLDWVIWPAWLSLIMACLDLVWMGVNACFGKKKSTGEII